MKKLVLFLVLQLIIFSISETPAQTNTREGPTVISFLPQGYGIKLLNSTGASSILNDVSNLGFMNPASISEFENYSLGISYQFNTSIDEAWIADFGTSRVYNFYPQSVGGIIKWNDFTFGLGFGQKYNGTLDIGEIEITTVQNPGGTGEFFTPTLEKMIHSYSISAAYSFNDISEIINELSFGFRYNLNRYDQYDEISELVGEAEDYFHSFNIGLFTLLKLDEQRKLGIGLSYETQSEFNAKFETNSDLIIDPEPIDPNRPPIYVKVDNNVTGSIPSELKFDLSIDALAQLSFVMNVSSIFLDNSNSNVKDQIEYSFSAIYQIDEMFTPSLGFYITDCEYTDNFYSRLNEGLNSLFMTAGLRFNYNNFSTDLAIADSHLFSGDYREQTMVKLAIGVQL